jgi:hypothetical protein
MRFNKTFQHISIEIFKNIFNPEQIQKMIEIDLSEYDNILNLPDDKYFEKRIYIGDNENSEADPNQIILATYRK